jgi:hypothetical protein
MFAFGFSTMVVSSRSLGLGVLRIAMSVASLTVMVVVTPAFAERISVEQAAQYAAARPAPTVTEAELGPGTDANWRSTVGREGPNPLDDYGRIDGPRELARGLGKFGTIDASARAQFNRTGDSAGVGGMLFGSASAVAVPEPAGLLLLGLGGLAYAVRRRRSA